MDSFRRVTINSNKFEQDNLKNGKFGGMKCRNITVTEIICFYGVMIRIYIDPRHL